jgi:hypothetical protein
MGHISESTGIHRMQRKIDQELSKFEQAKVGINKVIYHQELSDQGDEESSEVSKEEEDENYINSSRSSSHQSFIESEITDSYN